MADTAGAGGERSKVTLTIINILLLFIGGASFAFIILSAVSRDNKRQRDQQERLTATLAFQASSIAKKAAAQERIATALEEIAKGAK